MTKSRWSRRRWSVMAAVVTAAGLLAVPGVASAADPTPIQAKYASLGGPGGVLGAAVGAEDCTLTGGGCVQEYVNGEIVWSVGSGAHALTDAALAGAWVEAGAEDGALRYPDTDVFCGLRDGGCGQHFVGGSVYRSAATGAVAVPDRVRSTWADTGWEQGPLGYPTAAPECGLKYGTCLQRFERGSVYEGAGFRASATYGAVLDVWGAQGWEHGPLGLPRSSVVCGLRDGGCGEDFENGSVYWSPKTGGHVVKGDVYRTWAAQGLEQGGLGLPVSDPFVTQAGEDGQHFQGGSVYEAWGSMYTVPGAIRDRWGASGWERGLLGPPVRAAFCGLRNGGCGQHFQFGSIYSSPAGTFAVALQPLRDRWAAEGWENGPVGYPTSEAFVAVYGTGQHFEGGSWYSSDTQGHFVSAAFMGAYAAQGWERGYLGFPTTDRFCGLRDGACGQHFQGGSIYSSPAGVFAVPASFTIPWGTAGWEAGALGFPTSPIFCGLRNGGCGQHFQGGSIYSRAPADSPRTSPNRVSFPVTQPFLGAWAVQGWENGRLGYPTGSAYPTPGGLTQPFERGSLQLVNGQVR